jgi:hypothetical protein
MNQLVPHPPEHAGEWKSCSCHVCVSRRKCNGHLTVIAYPPGERAGNNHAYELECETCGHVGCADTLEQAQTIRRMHEELEALLVDTWKVPEDWAFGDPHDVGPSAATPCGEEQLRNPSPTSPPAGMAVGDSCCGKAAPSSEDLDQ